MSEATGKQDSHQTSPQMILKHMIHCAILLISLNTLPKEFLSECGLNVLRTEGAR